MSSSGGLGGFYANKDIFVTGASGFVGVCLLEKILRSVPEHGNIYLMLRPKRGKQIEERLEEIKKNSVFEKLLEKESVEKVFSKVFAVAGDVGEDNLGLSPDDRRLLTENVNIIIHSAATLDFGDTLKTTVNINLLGTRRIVELAKQCRSLKALVHISSAYVNAFKLETEEVIYPLHRDADELIALTEKLSDEEMERQTPEILGDHPNTYTITKHMAEHEVQKAQELFPCAIVRPSMIVGSWKEPIPGWTISKNGPQGFFMGAAKGVIRRLPVGTQLIYDYIPVDIVVNNVLAAGFYAGMTQSKKVSIFHCTTSTRKPFRWAFIEDQVNSYLHKYPLKSAVWYPYLKFSPSVTRYRLSALFVHFLPAILLDLVTRVSGGRPILMKLHRNVNTSLDRLEKFIFTEWKFDATKADELEKWLSSQDQTNFYLDVSKLEWVEYFKNLVVGARVYLSKDPIKTLPTAKTRNSMLLVLHVILQVSVYVMIWFFVAKLIGTTLINASFILPVTYLLLSFL